MATTVTLLIANGTADSAVQDPLPVAPAMSILLMAPGTLPETVKVQVCATRGGTYVDLQTNGSDVVMAAGKGTQITVLSGCFWKLHSGSNVGADRTFTAILNAINGQWGVP